MIHVLNGKLPQALTHNIYYLFIVLSVLFHFMYELLPLTKTVRICFLAISACLERHWSPTYLIFTPHSVNTWKHTRIHLMLACLAKSSWCSNNSLFSASTLQTCDNSVPVRIWIIWLEQGLHFKHKNIQLVIETYFLQFKFHPLMIFIWLTSQQHYT